MFGQSAKPLSGRYFSFAEREDIALLRAQGHSMREVARRLGRAASTISWESRRNAATRSGGLEYRATTAQWHAERAARRPKQGKLAINTALRASVEATGWQRRRSERGSCAWPSRVLERPSTWMAEGSAVGKRLEPGADRPPAPDRLPGR